MTIVYQRSRHAARSVTPAQRRECGTASLPSSIDIERMLRADRVRSTHYRTVASGLAASWREVLR